MQHRWRGGCYAIWTKGVYFPLPCVMQQTSHRATQISAREIADTNPSKSWCNSRVARKGFRIWPNVTLPVPTPSWVWSAHQPSLPMPSPTQKCPHSIFPCIFQAPELVTHSRWTLFRAHGGWIKPPRDSKYPCAGSAGLKGEANMLYSWHCWASRRNLYWPRVSSGLCSKKLCPYRHELLSQETHPKDCSPIHT